MTKQLRDITDETAYEIYIIGTHLQWDKEDITEDDNNDKT